MGKIKRYIGKFLRQYMMGVYRYYERIYWFIVEKRKKKGLRKLGYDYLKKINENLEKSGFQYFITYGTLLGIIREGQFMGHDNDIDMGIIYDDNFSWDKLEEALKQIGMSKKHQFTMEGKITEQTYIYGKLSVDFFMYEQFDDNHQVSYVYFRQETERYEEGVFEVARHITKKIEGLKKIETSKGAFSVPENAEDFLEEVYGKDWRVPQPDWKPKRDIVQGKYGYLEK
ncbi:LicD family protein [Faecalimonas sp.]